MVHVVWAVPALVVPTMAVVAVDVPVDPGAHALPSPLLEKKVARPAPAARSLWRPLGEIAWNNTWRYGRTIT